MLKIMKYDYLYNLGRGPMISIQMIEYDNKINGN
jgi:hypothetical protein